MRRLESKPSLLWDISCFRSSQVKSDDRKVFIFPKNTGPKISALKIALNVVVEAELVWMWPESNRIRLILPLVGDPGIDHVLGDNSTDL